MGKTAVTVEIDGALLATYTDSHLATLWQVAQADPAPHGDRPAGDLAERIVREIIRRWLSASQPELWQQQGRDYYWSELRKLDTWNADGVFAPGNDTQQEDTA